MNISPKKVLVSAVKDEAPHLIEWLAYYKVLGFDEFYIVYNPSNDNTAELLRGLEEAGELRCRESTLEFNPRPQANAAVLFNKADIINPGDWVFWPDSDEFLNIHIGDRKVNDLISYLEERNSDAMLVNWRVMGDSGRNGIPGRYIDYGWTGASDVSFDGNRECKTFWKFSDKFKGFPLLGINRPLVNAESGTPPVALRADGNPIKVKYEHNKNWLQGIDTVKTSMCNPKPIYPTVAQLNHYIVRTSDALMLKRVRGRGFAKYRNPEKVSDPENNNRHTESFFIRRNRNEHVDDSILWVVPELNREIDRLMKLPGIAELHRQAVTDTIERLQKIKADENHEVKKPSDKLPDLILPDDAAQFLEEQLAQSHAYLEYGSGGSTVMALRKGVADVFSVECDLDWAESLQHSISENDIPSDNLHLHQVYIGPVRAWSRPKSLEFVRHFEQYPNSVWERGDFVHPDLVLIDGRFRVACFMTCAVNAKKPMRILFDDYTLRPYYKAIEDVIKPVKTVDRLAVFDIVPGMVKASDLLKFIKFYVDFR